MSVNVAAALELRQRSSPSGRVGVLALDVARNLASRKEVDADGGRVPQCGVDTASDGVKPIAVGVGVTGQNLTAGVVPLTRRVGVAVGSGHGSGEAAVVGDGTTSVSVQGHVIRALVVDALDNIDLTIVRPVRSNHPADTFISLCPEHPNM